MFAWKDENKRKRGRDGPFKNLDSLICSARKSSIKYQSSPQPSRQKRTRFQVRSLKHVSNLPTIYPVPNTIWDDALGFNISCKCNYMPCASVYVGADYLIRWWPQQKPERRCASDFSMIDIR